MIENATITIADLYDQLPNIFESGAWGKIRTIKNKASEIRREIGLELLDALDKNLIDTLTIKKEQIFLLIMECDERMEMIMVWNDEKAREIDDYIINTPFMDFNDHKELTARKGVFRSIANGIKQDLGI